MPPTFGLSGQTSPGIVSCSPRSAYPARLRRKVFLAGLQPAACSLQHTTMLRGALPPELCNLAPCNLAANNLQHTSLLCSLAAGTLKTAALQPPTFRNLNPANLQPATTDLTIAIGSIHMRLRIFAHAQITHIRIFTNKHMYTQTHRHTNYDAYTTYSTHKQRHINIRTYRYKASAHVHRCTHAVTCTRTCTHPPIHTHQGLERRRATPSSRTKVWATAPFFGALADAYVCSRLRSD